MLVSSVKSGNFLSGPAFQRAIQFVDLTVSIMIPYSEISRKKDFTIIGAIWYNKYT